MAEALGPYPFPSSIHVSSSVTLKLNDSNYLLWKTQFESLLSCQKLLGFVTGQIPPPEATVTATVDNVVTTCPNPKFEAWTCTDQLIKSWLFGTLTEEVLGYVHGLATSKDVWLSLADNFNKRSVAREFDLRRKLQLLSNRDKNFPNYCREIRAICDQLSSIGKPVDEKMKVFTFLNGLGREYDTISAVVQNSMSRLPVPTFNDVVSEISGFHTRLQSYEVLGYVHGLATPKDVWLSLADNFNKSSVAREFDLRRKLQLLSNRDKNFPNYCREFRAICDQLSSIGKPVDEKMKVFTFLNGLGRQYDPISAVVQNSMSRLPVPTFNDVVSEISGFHTRLQSYETPADVTPFTAFQVQKQGNLGQRGRANAYRAMRNDVVVADGRRFPQYMHLSQLEVGYSTNPVIGRLIRLWETRNIWNGNEIGKSFLLLDQKGDVIECFIHAARITKYNNIKEGFIYVIYGYNVISKCKYQITNNPFTINFTDTTTIVEVVGNAPKIPRQQLMLSNYRGLLSLANTDHKLPDVVGQIRYVQGFKREDPHSTTEILVRLLIKAKPKTIVPLVLWNEIAANFRRQICLPKLDQFTIVVTSVNPKIYQGNLQLNSTSATRFFKKDKRISVKRFLKRNTRSK